MYNPVRHAPNRPLHQQRRRTPPPGSGTTHGEIVRKHGSSFAVPTGAKKDTATGVSVKMFDGEGFTTRYEAMRMGSASGRMVNPSDERSYYVLSGVCFFLTYENDGVVKDTIKCLAGGAFGVSPGVEFEIATTGDQGCELHITESPLYDKHLTHLTAPVVDESKLEEQFVSRESIVPVQRREQDPMAVQNQIDRANQTMIRRAQRAGAGAATPNANSANSIGVNLKPGGWSVEE